MPMNMQRASLGRAGLLALALVTAGCGGGDGNGQVADTAPAVNPLDQIVRAHADDLLQAGREAFRFDTFGDQVFWGDTLRLHQAVAGEANGGVGAGLSPRAALGLGLKVDAEALPQALRDSIVAGKVDLDAPATTVALLQLNSVVGVTGFFDENRQLRSMGTQCALCHSTVDNSLAPGIGRRLDGWTGALPRWLTWPITTIVSSGSA